MTEPDITYIYRKGEGWIPVCHNAVTDTVGKYKVTIFERKPTSSKEHFIFGSEEETAIEILEGIKTYDKYRFDSDPRWYYSRWTKSHERQYAKGYYSTYKFFTLHLERIKPPKKPRTVRVRTRAR